MVSHRASIKVLGLGVSSEGMTGEGFTSKLIWLLARNSTWQVVGMGASVSCHVDLTTGQMKTWQLTSIKPAGKRMGLQGCTYNLM